MLTPNSAGSQITQAIALVSTPHFVLAVDLDSGALWLVGEGAPEYYGISWFPGSDELALSHTGVDSRSLSSREAIQASERGWVSLGVRALPARLASPHQILCAQDGRVICTNTGRNAVAVLDLCNPAVVQVARISECDWDRLEFGDMTGDHLNSVFLRGSDLFVMAHGFTRGAKLARFDYPSLNLLEVRPVPLRTGLHNVWVTDEGEAIVCDSNAGALINAITNEVLWRCPAGEPRYLKGLAATESLIVVGASPVVARSLRSASATELWLIRREDYATRAGWNLGTWGAVQEVRIANMPDEAHHGHVFAGLGLLLESAVRQSSATPLSFRGVEDAAGASAWAPFHRLIVAGSFASDGAFAAAPEYVSLFVERRPMTAAERTVEFDFDFDFRNGATDAHCAVVMYEGFGGDTHMDAFVLHAAAGSGGSLSHWANDGSVWRAPTQVRSGLPRRGHYCVRVGPATVDIMLNGMLSASVPVSSLNFPHGRLGIRMSGCRVAQPRISYA